MIVVADTSPLNYLVLIDAIDCLQLLYGVIHIPPACADELTASGTPAIVRTWFENRPHWVIITAPDSTSDSRLVHLDKGEREALSLALECQADLVLIDERDGRMTAERCGLTIAGTLRVLADAALIGAVDLTQAFGRLRAVGFRADPRLMDLLLRENHS